MLFGEKNSTILGGNCSKLIQELLHTFWKTNGVDECDDPLKYNWIVCDQLIYLLKEKYENPK